MIILHHTYGQMANRMILIIHFTAFCLENNIALRILNFEEYLKEFDHNSLSKLKEKNIQFKRKTIFWKLVISLFYRMNPYIGNRNILDIKKDYDEKDIAFDLKELKPLSRHHRILLPEGWLFRCSELTQQHQEKIASLFKPNSESSSRIEEFLNGIPEDRITVGVHIRRRDYREFQHGKYFYDDNTYLSLMDQFERLFENKAVQFLVFSDEPISDLIRDRKHVSASENNFIEDFFLMSHCDYLMGPPSTFTLVSSYLGSCKLFQIEEPRTSLNIEDFKPINAI
jgi:hypothetical protein